MKKILLAAFIIFTAVMGGLGELCGWLLPTLSWPFTVSREIPVLSLPGEYCEALAVDGRVNWFGWLCMLVLLLVGVALLLRKKSSLRMPPEMKKRWKRFRSIRRGYWSLNVLMLLLVCAAADQCLVGKRALFVEKEDGTWVFPAFSRDVLPGSTFGLTGNAADAETDYHQLKKTEGRAGCPKRVILPPIPYDSTLDADSFPTEALIFRDGTVYAPDNATPYNGLACRFYPDGQTHLRMRYRKGKPDGQIQGWDTDGKEVFTGTIKNGKIRKSFTYTGTGTAEEFLKATSGDKLHLVHYHPAPPMVGGHLLGTNSQGLDIAAYLFGGLQVIFKAALLYLPVVYAIGLTIGMLMGYFGGKFDMATQRGIEILSQLPFLFVVMILSALVPLEFRGMFLILMLMAVFGWMGMTYIVRTATMKEKTRDFVAAARVMGAGPLHILLRHILPNMVGIIVTLLPFSVAAVILSLTSLDYLGFGLPDTYASWGRLLNDGLSKLSSPWVASAAFGSIAIMLLIVTFIGEAVREAVDPHRFTYYD